MSRATTKSELIKMANEQFSKLWKMIDKMSETEQTADFCFDAPKRTMRRIGSAIKILETF